MTTIRIAIASALAAALVLPAAAQAQGNMEKCYGVAKAGKNDCQTAKSSCAGTATARFISMRSPIPMPERVERR